MEYDEFIQNIIDTRGQHNIPEEQYKEIHHIVPHCMGGLPDKVCRTNTKHENLIWLTGAEHFIAHKLLLEKYPDNKRIQHAYAMMAFVTNPNNPDKREITPEEYEAAKAMLGKISSEMNTGRICTEETRKKMSKSRKGKTFSEEHKKHLSESAMGKHKLYGENNPHYGIAPSEETKDKWRATMIEKNGENYLSGSNNPNYGKKHPGTHWYNNGIVQTRALTCPEGFVLGTLAKANKNTGKHTGKHWYNNGISNICAVECPEGYVPGAIQNHKKNGGL